MADSKQLDMVPDPDEDDLSDLDDVLDEFSATRIEDKKPPTSAPSAASAAGLERTAQAATNPPHDDADFEKQLQAGMAELLGEFGSSTEMQKEFEKMMKELGQAAGQEGEGEGTATTPHASTQTADKASSKPKATGEESFQDTIRKTMERMQNSGDAASAAAQTADENDVLAQMMKEMEKGNFPGMDGDEEGFNKMLMGMMEQLTNKDILYEPMKDLHDKFPAWLEKNSDKTEKEDLKRYKEQQSIVDDIVARFERKGYNDDNQQDREYIVEKMQQMQAAGSPPPDLVGDMGAAQEMLADPEGSCPQQ